MEADFLDGGWEVGFWARPRLVSFSGLAESQDLFSEPLVSEVSIRRAGDPGLMSSSGPGEDSESMEGLEVPSESEQDVRSSRSILDSSMFLCLVLRVSLGGEGSGEVSSSLSESGRGGIVGILLEILERA